MSHIIPPTLIKFSQGKVSMKFKTDDTGKEWDLDETTQQICDETMRRPSYDGEHNLILRVPWPEPINIIPWKNHFTALDNRRLVCAQRAAIHLYGNHPEEVGVEVNILPLNAKSRGDMGHKSRFGLLSNGDTVSVYRNGPPWVYLCEWDWKQRMEEIRNQVRVEFPRGDLLLARICHLNNKDMFNGDLHFEALAEAARDVEHDKIHAILNDLEADWHNHKKWPTGELKRRFAAERCASVRIKCIER